MPQKSCVKVSQEIIKVQFQLFPGIPEGIEDKAEKFVTRECMYKYMTAETNFSNAVFGVLRNDWWVWVDLNHRPHPYQGCALTN